MTEAGTFHRPRLPFIDGLRGLALLMVLLYHASMVTVAVPIRTPLGAWSIPLTAPFRYGYLGVDLFFVLSGFCLTLPLIGNGTDSMRLDVGRFWRRRAWRILPPYYAALALFALRPALERAFQTFLGWPHGTVRGYAAGSIVSHALLIHDLFPAWSLDINAVFWTLAVEWQFYLIFPLLVWSFRRWGPPTTLIVVIAATLLYRTWIFAHGYLFFASVLPGRLLEFVLGMLAATLFAQRQYHLPWSRGRGYVAAVAALGCLTYAVHARWTFASPPADLVAGLTFFCLLMYAAGRSAGGGVWLATRPLVALGRISYSVYLVHLPVVAVGRELLLASHVSPLTRLVLFDLAVAPLAVGIGWLFFQAVEAPFLYGRRSASARIAWPQPAPSGGVRHG
jgi:peptidoglycan/LPS O-acetylase OafA/YrhL